MSVIDEVKQRTDIVDVVSQYTTLSKAGRIFKGLCPFHTEKHGSFFVYPEQQSWHCFGACNTGGDVFSFIMKKQGIDFGEALRLLAQRAGVELPSRVDSQAEGKKKDRLFQINQVAAQYFHQLLLSHPPAEKARGYLASRKLSLETVTRFQLGLSPSGWEALKQHLLERGYDEGELLEAGLIVEKEAGSTHDRFRNRLMFPICDSAGHVIGFGARALDDNLPKYINSPQTATFDKSGSLYAINLAASTIRQQGIAVMVEGYMDVITAHQGGFANVVASMGTSITERQINTLKRLTKNIVLALDADAAGEEAMLRCVSYENNLGAELKVVVLPAGKDPDNVIKEDPQSWQRLLEQALPVVDYTFNMAVPQFDLDSAQGKSSAVDKLLPMVAEIGNAIRREHYMHKLARLVRVSDHTMEQKLEEELAKRRAYRRAKSTVPRAASQTLRPLLSEPREEHCLALLLQHPELKDKSQELSPEYFADTQNREVFVAYIKADKVQLIREELDSAFHERLDALLTMKLPTAPAEQVLNDYVFQLKMKYLKNLEAKKSEALAAAAELGGSAAELAKLQELGMEISTQLKELDAQRTEARTGTKGVNR